MKTVVATYQTILGRNTGQWERIDQHMYGALGSIPSTKNIQKTYSDIAAKSVPFPLTPSEQSSWAHMKFANEHIKAQAIYFGTVCLHTLWYTVPLGKQAGSRDPLQPRSKLEHMEVQQNEA